MKKLLIAALLIPAIANAGFITGNTLLEKMTSPEAAEKAFALGYVVGAFDAFDELAHCNAPASVTAGQARDIVKKYIENNPAIRNKSADFLIMTALGQIWPCSKKPAGRGT
jgi:hypothetical protein